MLFSSKTQSIKSHHQGGKDISTLFLWKEKTEKLLNSGFYFF